jgi:hypothetical protein
MRETSFAESSGWAGVWYPVSSIGDRLRYWDYGRRIGWLRRHAQSLPAKTDAGFREPCVDDDLEEFEAGVLGSCGNAKPLKYIVWIAALSIDERLRLGVEGPFLFGASNGIWTRVVAGRFMG